ncbi:hypothetical protein EHV15_35340 [Paenibacillus oralis]|uniref:Uncharacterized protein n=2 Tax=Paenibacillus oralis TaxID=2490856 RepID=A0A3P3TA76_9BACL|nr:hypothetical protein EHV15_35340 [Paenibacillus oralis]
MNIHRMQRFVLRFFIFMLFIPTSIFTGLGIVSILHWQGYTKLPDVPVIILGASTIFILYMIPKGLTHIIAQREIKNYFPITNDTIRSHRQFYKDNINQEISYLKQAIEAFRVRGMRDDYNIFVSKLNTFIEIKSLLQKDMDLHRDHLVCLNQVFNKRYLLKKLQN